MPQHRYEGEVLESLLTQVRAEHGPHVEIIEAEKVRLGGIGGFFAREGFALTVDVPDPGPEPVKTTPVRSSLAERADETDDSIALGPAPEITSSRPGVPSIGDRSIVTHQPTNGRLLQGQGGLGAAPVPAPTGRVAAIDALLNRADEISLRERTSSGDPVVQSDNTLSGDAAHFRDVLRHSLEEAARTESASSGVDVAPRPGTDPAPLSSPPQPSPRPTPGTDIHPLAGWSRQTPDTGDRSVRSLVGRLTEIREALEQRGPDRQVRVTAVLGEATVGLRAARRIAVEAGLPPDSVVVGQPLDRSFGVRTWNLAPGIPQMIERSRHWRANAERAVVLLPISDLSPASIELTRSLLDAMAPDEVRLVVPGTPPSFQLANLAAELGRIDVLDLIEVDDAAGVLDLVANGYEVGSIEGERVDASLLVAIEGLAR
ncbi:MAG: hypothetical protein GY745_11450 [Actinomycetia bacterium]|nr:hypothetical protein [Actinomycetes bacterium]